VNRHAVREIFMETRTNYFIASLVIAFFFPLAGAARTIRPPKRNVSLSPPTAPRTIALRAPIPDGGRWLCWHPGMSRIPVESHPGGDLWIWNSKWRASPGPGGNLVRFVPCGF